MGEGAKIRPMHHLPLHFPVAFFLLTILLSVEAKIPFTKGKSVRANAGIQQSDEIEIATEGNYDGSINLEQTNGDRIPTVKRKRIAIIGAGVSGLAAAKAFSEQGHEVIGFERSSSIGGVWDPKRSYPGVKTQSPKDLYRYTDMPMPDEYPEWPSGEQVISYLESYAQKHDLLRHFRFGNTVTGINKRKKGERGWVLLVQNEKKRWEDLTFDFVVICSGIFTDPYTICYPGENDFIEAGGRLMHSSEFMGQRGDIEGKHVVVIGGSKSATDIAVHAALNGAQQVTLLIRRNVWRIPYFLLGVNHKHLYMKSQEVMFPSWKESSVSPFCKLLSLVAMALIMVYFWLSEVILSLVLGLKKWDMVPKERLFDSISCGIPIATEGMIQCFRDGRIRPINSLVETYIVNDDGRFCLGLKNGERIQADTVVQATGWTMDLPFLSESEKEKLIDADGLYRLYRFAVNPRLPNIGFVGFNTSACSVLSSEMIANWLVRYADGMLGNQKSLDEMDSDIEKLLEWKRNVRPASKIFGGNCVAPFHHLYFDEILNDMKATVKNKYLFRYPDAKKYGECLRSAPKYFVA